MLNATMNADPRSQDLSSEESEALASLIWLAPGMSDVILRVSDCLSGKPGYPDDAGRTQEDLRKISKALKFVGECSLAIFVEAIIQALDHVQAETVASIATAAVAETAGDEGDAVLANLATAASIACKALLQYLESLKEETTLQPLRLFGAYKALLSAIGQEKIHPADLIFPDPIDESSLRFPFAIKAASSASGTDLAECRTEFESVLLQYLRTTEDATGTPLLQHMAAIISTVIHADAASPHLHFWRVIDVAMTLLAAGVVDVDHYAKKFLGQVNLQLRRLVSGSCKGDMRLMREGLFFIALAPVSEDIAQAIKQANALPDLQQADYQHSHHSHHSDLKIVRTAPSSQASRETGLADMTVMLARAEAMIEACFDGADAAAGDSRAGIGIAGAIRELVVAAERLRFDELARLLTADALRIEHQSTAGAAMTIQSPAMKDAICDLAALSLSLPLMRHGAALPLVFHRSRMGGIGKAGGEILTSSAHSGQSERAEPVVEADSRLIDNTGPEEPAQEDHDPELMEIFLTEADDILATLENSLVASRNAPGDMAHIIVLRRGFHTLKGSCRMVGLNAMSDGAMAVESFLNDWSASGTPGVDADYVLLDRAKQDVAEWISEIREAGKSRRSPAALIAAVDKTRQGKKGGYGDAAAEDNPALATPETTPSMRVGDLDIPVQLHRIYSDESAALLAVIKSSLEQWQGGLPNTIDPELLRATHSLKSSSASVQFVALQMPAQVLDEIMKSVAHSPEVLDADICACLLPIVGQLCAMQQVFASGQMPRAREDVQQQLVMLLEELKVRHREASAIRHAQGGDGSPVLSVSVDEATDDAYEDLIDPELLEIFLEEGRDLLPQIGESLYKLQKSPDDRGLIQYLLRPLHTIKGSARMAGAMRLGQHMHELETSIDEMVRNGMPSTLQIDDLLARYDHGLQLFEALQASPSSTPISLPLSSSLLPLAASSPLAPVLPIATTVPQSPASPHSPGELPAGKSNLQIAIPVAEAATPSDSDTGKNSNAAPLVRIRAGILDSLLNQAGEISISRSGLESEINVLRRHLADLGGNVSRLTAQLREVEIQAEIQIAASNQRQPQDQHFDPLEFDRFTHLQEMTRMLAESVNDVASVQKNLLETVDHAQNSLTQQARLTREMQQELMQARMVQFRGVEERLHRLVRQMAKETGKELELEIIGSAVELDRSILEKMVGPFEHLLRNAAAHGIEAAEQRRAAGKPAVGHLSLQVGQEGNEVTIRLSDDGQGLDLERIHEKAVRLGLIDGEQRLSDAELSGIIFQPGFTTSAGVTAIAGRGVGMDVVRSEVASLGGRISIDTVAGKGATFVIHLPLSLAVTQVVLLELGAQTYAIPSLLVEQVLQFKADRQAEVFLEGSIEWQGRKLPMHYLPVLLGEDKGVPTQQTLSILVVKSGHDFLAILVDHIIGNREVVTKNIGPQLAHMVGVVGATVLGSGTIALILNPIQLAQRHGYQKVLRQLEPVAADNGSRKKTILVVDDSLTVRRVMQRLLTREGYHVVLATDGVDALHQLQSMRPDIALVDIEMPRMDGFDLTRNIRDMAVTATLPIIMITSRTAAKHRERAMELGVNEYLGKPYQDDILLEMIRSLIDEEGTRPSYDIDQVLFKRPEPPLSPA